MTSARIQPFGREYNINIGYYDGFRVYPRSITHRDIALKIHENHFYLMWKSNGIRYDKAIKELKDNFKVMILLYLTNMLKVLLNTNTNLKQSNLN